ncbi:MAG: (NiFe) hydrogenase maturation protein HypF, partial [Acidobacteria bacterium]|nr:(NiFe) hydrogenase maturation protein HypF [Acidobacteriota bacterium]
MSSSLQSLDTCRRRILVSGIVQGVGFRPFVHNLAHALELRGFVRNSDAGVVIEAEGRAATVDRFVESLRESPPPLAQVDGISVSELPPQQTSGFTIEESAAGEASLGLVSPDVALCDDCRRELHDPADRRFGYPFINCTHCGPRYTIIRALPYDRPTTTMVVFPMCDRCRAEYDDPRDRRFHAQPNACPDCGPGLALSANGDRTPAAFDAHSASDVVARVQVLLAAGTIVAIRSVGGFHLACDAASEAAVARLRERKRRGGKPFAVMARDLATAERLCVVSDADRALLLGAEHPIVIMTRRDEAGIAAGVAPGSRMLGLMLPYTPLHELLFAIAPFDCLVMTSGNRSEEPIVTANDDAVRQLAGIADAFVLHDRDIHMRADDSVVRTFEGRPRTLRRSRGYAPRPIDLGEPVSEILACGAELKNTLCLTRDHHAIVSQHIGDLSSYETMQFFEETLANLKRLFRIEPRAVAHDLHPLYATTRYARSLTGIQQVGVQHHHAHIASCMADNGIRGRVIGVAMDGTGYGTDGAIWGSEFLVADFGGFERRAHLRYVPLAGGDAAVRQPWHSALAHLRDARGGEIPAGLPLFDAVPKRSLDLVGTMLTRGLNTIPTSSCGRLFDAVASIIGVRHEITYEAEAAIELEMLAAEEREEVEPYPFAIAESEMLEIDVRPMIVAIVEEMLRGTARSRIAARFHATLAAVIDDVCRRIRGTSGINRACLSGGVFQNVVLLEQTARALRRSGFDLYLHSRVPPN